MISPDLVRVRKRNGVLALTPPSLEGRSRARALGELVLTVIAANVDQPRSVVDEQLALLVGSPQERKLLSALKKLALDDSTFDSDRAEEAPTLRRAVFTRATVARQALGMGDSFNREAVIAEVARELGLTAEAAEDGLYADLRSRERLRKAPGYAIEHLLVRHARAEIQAVLLCSVRVAAEVTCSSADQYRELFHKLKFRQLLFQLSRSSVGGYTIEIDGPYSLFESVTKYGLELALLLPALEACDSVKLSADLRWGKKREALKFSVQLNRAEMAEPAPLRDEIRDLLEAFADAADWQAEPAREVLDLPGIGLCVPDLCFTQKRTGEQVLCEVLGFWSRAAVWRRVELVQSGMATKIVFVASARLRVSEEVLDGEESAALYVYKGSINAKALQRKLDQLVAPPKRTPRMARQK